ncbi:MAG TPA: heme NO-binding domain-containing protein [Chloroflexota bacterium]
MHGIIFSELKKYVETRFGASTWPALLKEAGLGSKLYMNVQSYPDQDAVALVMTASRMTGKPAPAILEDFGEFIAPDLLNMYRTLVRPEWKTIELLENVEHTIHTVVRARHPGAAPAQIACTRTGPNEAVLTYTSARKMCPVAQGIIRGLGTSFKQQVSIDETSCMHRGNPSCRMTVRVTG